MPSAAAFSTIACRIACTRLILLSSHSSLRWSVEIMSLICASPSSLVAQASCSNTSLVDVFCSLAGCCSAPPLLLLLLLLRLGAENSAWYRLQVLIVSRRNCIRASSRSTSLSMSATLLRCRSRSLADDSLLLYRLRLLGDMVARGSDASCVWPGDSFFIVRFDILFQPACLRTCSAFYFSLLLLSHTHVHSPRQDIQSEQNKEK
ncbi:hypothetical protein GQ54DRAFT_23779 [Martensiomyces pterosporus]|nr:hypothetical protein GQ54DRAFT_23779 [Martensiomyces pterosporus]